MKSKGRFFLALIMLLLVPRVSFCQDKKVFDKKFALVSGYLIDATIFDVESTYAGLRNCPNCFEANPVMEPFISNGRPAAYLFQGAIGGLIIYQSYRFKERGNKYWWLIPVIVGSAHTIAGGFNMRYVF